MNEPAMKRLTVEEFRAAIKAQNVPSREDYAFICPMCGVVQSARDLITAGAGEDFNAVEKYVGFSCVGRFIGAPSPRREHDGSPCNWTLGGLFQTHRFEVITEDGRAHPHFEPASPEAAQAHAEASKEWQA